MTRASSERGTAGAPVIRRRRPGGQSGPPEGFLCLGGDVRPGQPDVVEISVAPLRELAAGPVALVPHVEGLADLGNQTWRMMICHRIVGQSRHFQLLELTWMLISASECTATNDNLYPFA